jgi:hypothetical protein
MNEADLRHGASVGNAPRIRSAITLTATHIEICSGRRAYTSISIHFGKRHEGPRTLQYPAYLPHCSVGPPPSGSSSPPLWSALGGTVECGPTAPPLAELLCQSRVIPPPADPGVGDSGFVFLKAVGAATVARLSQLLWPKYGPFTPLATGATWSDKALQITCTVGPNEIRCSNSTRNGFTISQTSYTPF